MAIVLLIVFALVMLGGLYLLSYVFVDKNTPKGIALIHGGAGALAIVLLFIASFFYPNLWYVLILFILTAVGGGILFWFDICGKKIPKSLALIHGLMALTGFIALLFLFNII